MRRSTTRLGSWVRLPRMRRRKSLTRSIVVETRVARRSAQSSATVPLGRINIEFRLAEREPTKGLQQVTVTGTDDRVYLHTEPIVTNRDIVEARALKSHYEDFFAVEITFTSEAAKRMS